MKNIQLRGVTYTPESFDMLVLDEIEFGHVTNAYCVAYALHATRSTATRTNIAVSLERLVAAGFLVRDDFAITDAKPAYRRVR